MMKLIDAAGKRTHAHSSLFLLLSLGCWVAWVFCIYSGDPFKVYNDSFFELTSDAFLYSTFALSVSLVVFSRFPHAGYKIIKSIPVVLSLGVLAGIFTFLEVLPSVIGGSLFPLFAAATGVCTSAIELRCAVQISNVRTKDALIVLAGAQIVAIFIYAFIFMITKSGMEVLALVILCALPFLGALFSAFAAFDQEGAEQVPFMSLPKPFWRLLCAVFILTLVFSLIRGYFPSVLGPQEFDLSRTMTAISISMIMIVIIVVSAYLPAQSNFGNVAYGILITASFLVVFVPLFGIDSLLIGSVAVALLAVSFYAVWAVLACVAHKSGASAIKVFGLGYGFAALGATAGVFIGNILHMSPEVNESTVSIVGSLLVVVSVIVALLFLNKRGINLLMIPAKSDDVDEKEETFDADVRPRFKLRCRQIAERHGLSPRETEVMLLMAKGKDAKAISEMLFVSYNTARTHIKNVYAKLDVHNRSEFIAVIDSEEEK